MRNFLITYDLGIPESRKDYTNLINQIKSYRFWAKPMDSVWLISSEKDAETLRNELLPFLDSNDKVLVIEVGKNWGTYGVSKEVNEWMHTNI